MALVIALAVLSELVRMIEPVLGDSRRLECPFGKAGRSLAFGALSLWIASSGPLPAAAAVLVPVFALLSSLPAIVRNMLSRSPEGASLKTIIGVPTQSRRADLP
jgi:hypothetical protein